MIFVFGSNLRGIHGAGAARAALRQHGAAWGVGEGRMGNSYALPTKDERIITMPLHRIKIHVENFLSYARHHEDLEFQVTAIGCGLAGYQNHQIAPLFERATLNCQVPSEWHPFLPNHTCWGTF